MINNSFKQLVVVCRDFEIDWNQFINPIYVGVETGIFALLKNKKTINFICGDNDTITKQQLKTINKKTKNYDLENITFYQEKDYLDSELAIISALERKLDFQQIVLVADGTRWDMLIASIKILKKYEHLNPILLGENNYCFILKAETEYIFTNWQLSYKYISIFALKTQELIYNFSGCKYYPNQDITVNINNIQTISNEFNNENENPKIIIKKGQCLVFLHKIQKL